MNLGRVQFARNLVSAKHIATAAVTPQPRSFGFQRGKANEARVQVTFTAADAPTPVYHGLQHRPVSVTPVSQQTGIIYTDVPLVADDRTVVVYCNTANTAAELIVR